MDIYGRVENLEIGMQQLNDKFDLFSIEIGCSVIALVIEIKYGTKKIKCTREEDLLYKEQTWKKDIVRVKEDILYMENK